MAKSLSLVIFVVLFGFISGYSARLPDSEETDKIDAVPSYENFKNEPILGVQPDAPETRLSRVIRAPPIDQSEIRRNQIKAVQLERAKVQAQIEKYKKAEEANKKLEEWKQKQAKVQAEIEKHKKAEEAKKKSKESKQNQASSSKKY